jgi:hypothetical protein
MPAAGAAHGSHNGAPVTRRQGGFQGGAAGADTVRPRDFRGLTTSQSCSAEVNSFLVTIPAPAHATRLSDSILM